MCQGAHNPDCKPNHATIFRIFRNYALVAAAIFLLQWFPVPVLARS